MFPIDSPYILRFFSSFDKFKWSFISKQTNFKIRRKNQSFVYLFPWRANYCFSVKIKAMQMCEKENARGNIVTRFFVISANRLYVSMHYRQSQLLHKLTHLHTRGWEYKLSFVCQAFGQKARLLVFFQIRFFVSSWYCGTEWLLGLPAPHSFGAFSKSQNIDRGNRMAKTYSLYENNWPLWSVSKNRVWSFFSPDQIKVDHAVLLHYSLASWKWLIPLCRFQ